MDSFINKPSKRVEKANLAFPDATVFHYSGLIQGLELPDPKNCHALTATIKTNANDIVTNNKRFSGRVFEPKRQLKLLNKWF